MLFVVVACCRSCCVVLFVCVGVACLVLSFLVVVDVVCVVGFVDCGVRRCLLSLVVVILGLVVVCVVWWCCL